MFMLYCGDESVGAVKRTEERRRQRLCIDDDGGIGCMSTLHVYIIEENYCGVAGVRIGGCAPQHPPPLSARMFVVDVVARPRARGILYIKRFSYTEARVPASTRTKPNIRNRRHTCPHSIGGSIVMAVAAVVLLMASRPTPQPPPNRCMIKTDLARAFAAAGQYRAQTHRKRASARCFTYLELM